MLAVKNTIAGEASETNEIIKTSERVSDLEPIFEPPWDDEVAIELERGLERSRHLARRPRGKALSTI